MLTFPCGKWGALRNTFWHSAKADQQVMEGVAHVLLQGCSIAMHLHFFCFNASTFPHSGPEAYRVSDTDARRSPSTECGTQTQVDWTWPVTPLACTPSNGQEQPEKLYEPPEEVIEILPMDNGDEDVRAPIEMP